MKKPLFSTITLLFIFLLTTSCEKLEKLDNFTITNNLKHTFDVSITEALESSTYKTSYLFDLREEDSDIGKYQDKIESFKVNRLGFQILDFDGSEDATFSGNFSFSKENEEIYTLVGQIEDLNLFEAFQSEEIYRIDLNEEEVKKFEQLLLQEKVVEIHLIGTLYNTPATFSIKLHLDLGTEISALR